MSRQTFLTIAAAVILIIVFFVHVTTATSLRFESNVEVFSPHAPACRTSQINVTFSSLSLDVGIADYVNFTNDGVTCVLDQIGPSVSFLRGKHLLFTTDSQSDYLSQNPVILLKGYSVYVALLLSSPKAPPGPAPGCRVVTANAIKVGQIGAPNDSTIKVPIETKRLCSLGENFNFLAY